METHIEHKIWTDEELMSLPEVEGKCELVNGELVQEWCGLLHAVLAARLGAAMGDFARDHDLGYALGSGLGCRMSRGNLRSPDVSFVTKDRALRMGKDIVAFLQGAPDLTVEIVSPSDSLHALKKKAAEYFENGCSLCWIVEPSLKAVLVMRPDGSETLLTSKDAIDGEDLLPGFGFQVGDLFEGLHY
ncbi:MAG: Uma2 family endonuclease [Thermodesulfobacteriota bacterium]